MNQPNETKTLIDALKVRLTALEAELNLLNAHREFYNTKARHLKSQIVLTEKQLTALGEGQIPMPFGEPGENNE